MFRSSFLIFFILTILIISFTYGKNTTSRKRQISSTHKPASIKICGPALVRMLDMICDRASQLLMKKERPSHEKRQMIIDDDPLTRTLLIKDYARKLLGFCL